MHVSFREKGHDVEFCWALKHKIQDKIEEKEIGTEMVPVGATPNVNNNPLPNHANINMIGEGDFQPQLLIGSEGTVVQLESELTDIPHVCLIGGESESEEEDDDDSYEENIADLFNMEELDLALDSIPGRESYRGL